MAIAEDLEIAAFLKGQPKKLFIGGRWVEAASGKTFETLNPATGEVLAKVAEGGADDIDRAVAAARASFDRGTWRDLPPAERAKILWQVGDMIEERATEFAQLEPLDNGMPINDALLFHAPLAAATFRYYAGWVTKLDGATQQISLQGKYLSYTLREPIGVVGQIIPWNFPLLMAAWKIAPALACGNSVVLKPSEETPLSALLLAELLQEAELPDGVLNVLPGRGEEAGARLAAHLDVDKIAFTGSTEVGKPIARASADSNLKRVSLGSGYFVKPRVFADVGGSMRIAREEIFGPVVAAIPFSDEEDLVAKANSTIYGLVAGVWTNNVARAHRVAHALKAGTVYVNCYHIVDPVTPWGGYKQSGWGRELGPYALDLYTELKNVIVDIG